MSDTPDLRCCQCYKEMVRVPGWPKPDRAFCSRECADLYEEEKRAFVEGMKQ